MGAKNKVIAGNYEGVKLIRAFSSVSMAIGLKTTMPIDKTTVESYEVITEDHRKSASSGVARGLAGGVLLGPVGMLAGGVSAKNKSVFQVALQFKDGKKSLVEVDDKIYKAIVKSCF